MGLWLLCLALFACPLPVESLFNDAAVPGVIAVQDNDAVELGVKFKPMVDGAITGIRFYKSTANTGTHVGSLWDENGQLLAQAMFTDETAAGWQQMDFSEPVPVAADALYVASYHTEVGYYSADSNFFTSNHSNGSHLIAPASDSVGGNGVYQYGSGGFPSSSFQAMNYWVDVVFTTDYTPPPTGHVTLTWDAVDQPQVGGYRLYYGQTPGAYQDNVDVGNITQATLDDLVLGKTYYFVVSAYPAPEYIESYSQSSFSNEVRHVMSDEIYLALPPCSDLQWKCYRTYAIYGCRKVLNLAFVLLKNLI